jgi:hypothetical protein
MVRWYHVILTAYGFWLPNDPRGSWSEFVASWELYKFGPATKTSTRTSVAHEPHDQKIRLAAKQALKYPAVRFDENQRRFVAEGFAQAVAEANYQLHALCIGYDHAHAILARHERTIEQISRHLKAKATMALNRAGAHPLQNFSRQDGSTPTP